MPFAHSRHTSGAVTVCGRRSMSVSAPGTLAASCLLLLHLPTAQKEVTQAWGPDAPKTKPRPWLSLDTCPLPSRAAVWAASRHEEPRATPNAGHESIMCDSQLTFISHLPPERKFTSLFFSSEKVPASTSKSVKLASPEGGGPGSLRVAPEKEE